MALIQDLPPELLIIIMEALIHNAHPKGHSDLLKAVLIVSKEWQATIQSTRSLWRTVSTEDPPSWVQQVLRNGEPDGPLNVRFIRSPRHVAESKLSGELVSSFSNRWMDLRIDSSQIPRSNMFTVPAPMLRNLSIFSVYSAVIHTPLADQFPLLQSLSLDRVAVPWDSPALRSTSLRHLFLSNLSSTLYRMSVLLDILASCTNLVLLSIRHVDLHVLSTADRPPINMAHLSHIDLQLHINATTILLERLQLPANTKYSVIVHSERVATWKRLEDILVPRLIRLIEEVPTAYAPKTSVRNTRNGWILNVSSGAFVLGIPGRMDLRPMLSVLGGIPVAVVYGGADALVSGMFGQLSLSKINEVLPNDVTHLRLLPDCPDFFGIFATLSESTDGGIRMFPELRVLDLEQGSGGFILTGLAFPLFLSRLTTLLATRHSTGRPLQVRFRCTDAKVKENDGLCGLSKRFPGLFVFRDDYGLEWWEKPDVPLDPNYEQPN